MSFPNILIALGISLLFGLAFRNKGRVYALMLISVVALYWLQPSLNISGYEIWLPTLVMSLIVLSWGLVSERDERKKWNNLLTGLTLIALIAGLEFISRIQVDWTWFNVTPVLMVPTMILALFSFLTLGIMVLPRVKPAGLWLMILVLLMIFIIIKIPVLSSSIDRFIVGISNNLPGPKVKLSPIFDLRWFGFSYIAFRLIHTLRDRQTGRLPQVSLAEYITYVVFFPALAAGPIDRIERFIKDLRQPLALDSEGWYEAGKRLSLGLFKKFVLVELLGFISLTPANSPFIVSSAWTWVLLYGYTLQIYLDFSGYTDIAIGLGRLLGFKLPENFNAPYLKTNLTQFWNNWHMTLTQWFRAYFFNPLTRFLRAKKNLPIWVIILFTQISTMVLIGLWHGITLNFVLWGLWHGLGLFIQNRWSDLMGSFRTRWLTTPIRQKAADSLGIVITFNFVALGWVFFGFSTLQESWYIFQRLFGL